VRPELLFVQCTSCCAGCFCQDVALGNPTPSPRGCWSTEANWGGAAGKVNWNSPTNCLNVAAGDYIPAIKVRMDYYDEASMLLCDGCDQGFHMRCAGVRGCRPPPGAWHCSGCAASTTIAGHGPRREGPWRSGLYDGDYYWPLYDCDYYYYYYTCYYADCFAPSAQ
jgi:hypothetical protein